MGIAETIAWVLIGGATAWIARTHWNYRCPGCAAKRMNRIAAVRGEPKRTAYLCHACGGQYLRVGRGPYVSVEEWESGVREGLPPARMTSEPRRSDVD